MPKYYYEPFRSRGVCEQNVNSGEWQFANVDVGHEEGNILGPDVMASPPELGVRFCDAANCCAGFYEEPEDHLIVGLFHNNVTGEETWYDPRTSAETLI